MNFELKPQFRQRNPHISRSTIRISLLAAHVSQLVARSSLLYYQFPRLFLSP